MLFEVSLGQLKETLSINNETTANLLLSSQQIKYDFTTIINKARVQCNAGANPVRVCMDSA